VCVCVLSMYVREASVGGKVFCGVCRSEIAGRVWQSHVGLVSVGGGQQVQFRLLPAWASQPVQWVPAATRVRIVGGRSHGG
jgi:hypothetical protein